MTEESPNEDYNFSEEVLEENKYGHKFKIVSIIFIVSAIVFTCLLMLFRFVQTPPVQFPIGVPITIEQGTGMREAISQIKSLGLIRSEVALYLVMMSTYESNSIKASTYVFDEPLSLRDLAYRLTQGDHRSDLIRITNTEGETAAQMALRAAEVLSDFDAEKFLTLAKSHEGKLFPETYYVPKNYSEQDYYNLLVTTFDEKLNEFSAEITRHHLTTEQIIILASILEREANSLESKRMVSGILQKRLEISMPLQVDATLEYILDKPLSELTAEDLDIESPYNTYLNYGLPPTAIGNPGIEAIEAVLNPTESDYLFYITGDDGNFYYAKNFDTHRANIAKYLR